MRPTAPDQSSLENSGRQATDKGDANIKSCGPKFKEHSNATPKTEAKSCGPGTQAFQTARSPYT